MNLQHSLHKLVIFSNSLLRSRYWGRQMRCVTTLITAAKERLNDYHNFQKKLRQLSSSDRY